MALTACLDTHGLSGHVCKGLQALGKHSSCVEQQHGRAMASVNLDTALAPSQPDDPRWDYGVEVVHNQQTRLVWIEVHPAMSSEVDTVCRKLQWLRQFLAQSRSCQNQSKEFYWVATDAGVHIDPTRQRRLAAAGLKKPTRRVVV